MTWKLFSILILPACLALSGCRDGDTVKKNSEDTEEAIFSEATVEEGVEQQSIDPLDLKKRYVRINFSILKRLADDVAVGDTQAVTKKIKLNVFTDEDITVLIDQVQKISESNIIYTGQVAGDLDSSVTLVMVDDVLAANIRRSDKTESYEIRTLGNVHSIVLRKDEADATCEEVEHEETDENPFDMDDVTNTLSVQAAPRIDILGAYTPNARIRYGGKKGIVALIQMGIADTNRALIDSGSTLQVRLVGTVEVKSNETGNWSNDLGYLRGKTDGKWDIVHTERARLGADQVSLVATYPNGGGAAGIGYLNATTSTAFTIVKNTAFSMYTFSHELGHNLGLRHTDGYVNSYGRFRTIIAYGTYPRIRRFSNPNLKYNGYRTGDSTHNEAAIINRRAATVAALVAPKVPVATFDVDVRISEADKE